MCARADNILRNVCEYTACAHAVYILRVARARAISILRTAHARAGYMLRRQYVAQTISSAVSLHQHPCLSAIRSELSRSSRYSSKVSATSAEAGLPISSIMSAISPLEILEGLTSPHRSSSRPSHVKAPPPRIARSWLDSYK